MKREDKEEVLKILELLGLYRPDYDRNTELVKYLNKDSEE